MNSSAMLLAIVVMAGADVVDQSATGFTSRNTAFVDAAPYDVYRVLVDVASWWDPAHTFSGAADNLSLDARAGGCFCEALANGGSVQHLEVAYAAPGALLRLRGGLGPLQQMAVEGSMTFVLTPSNGGTEVTLTYTVGGYYPDGLDTFAAAVDGVLGGQLERLADVAGR